MRSAPHPRSLRIPLPLLLLAFVLTLAPAFSATPAAAPAPAAPVRIMLLGDSITGSPGCWREALWNRLRATARSRIDFVGTLSRQRCPQAFDGDNEGHGGELVTHVADRDLLPGRLASTRPDIVLMHFGTNDVWRGVAPDRILAAYTELVAQMRAANPDMKILVAQILPMNPVNCAACAGRVTALNARIPGWARATSTARSPVTAVDQWTGFHTSVDTYDGVHPSAAGNTKIAARWYPALAALL